MPRLAALATLGACALLSAPAPAQSPVGYYRFPAVHGDTVVFTAEGDLWLVGLHGGVARRLTTHLGEESHAAISPDGHTVAFSASYEGPTEVYTMPIDGGLPTRRTYEGGTATVAGWTPDGRKVIYATRRYSTLPDVQLATVDISSGALARIPLAQANDGSYDPDGRTLFFTRFPFQGSNTKRYKGGTAQNIWKFTAGAPEAVELTSTWPGTSRTPMVWQGRLYFVTDRDGTLNLWSSDENGGDEKQLTHHVGWDVLAPSLSDGHIVYQLGADLWRYDIATGADSIVPVRLASDFDQERVKWIADPMEWVTSVDLSPTGDRVVLVARGQLFVAPVGPGRLVEAPRKPISRYRGAHFMPDGRSLITLSDASGEVELWTVPANGVGQPTQLTTGATVLRWDAVPSPDGKRIAHYDKDQRLWLYDLASRKSARIATSDQGGFSDLAWSPDSRWLAYVAPAASNGFDEIFVYDVVTGRTTPFTTDRYESYSPAWSPDGKWLYFLSDRTFNSVVGGPWGPRQPEPYFDRTTGIYQLALRADERSPFEAMNELTAEQVDSARSHTDSARSRGAAPPAKVAPGPTPAASRVTIDLDGIESRITEVPVPAGDYSALTTDGKRLYWLSRERPGVPHTVVPAAAPERGAELLALPISNMPPAVSDVVMDHVQSYVLSRDARKLLVRKGNDLYVFDAGTRPPTDLARSKVDLHGWSFAIDPREEWRQMFDEAWRLERDYFYDRGMNGIDWRAMHDKYLPLVSRVTDRAELSDIFAQMIGELSALHMFVRGGDLRRGTDQAEPGSLGAELVRDQGAGGWRVAHVYRADPDVPDERAPLARPGVNVGEGDVVTMINGAATLPLPDPAAALENQGGREVLLRVRPKSGGAERDVIVIALTPQQDAALRYDDWEYSRRQAVETRSGGRIGYVHLRAMGAGDIDQWARDFYPVFARQGLIIDMRHNRGGNIDSWVLEKLMRKAWFYWQPRVGRPYWNMQDAFRGHMVVLTDQFTASDGEAFSEGFKRLGLGKVIGMRTWGGEIWLSSSNFLVDRGIATAAENGVYGPEGTWLIEGHGVDPDIVVDDPPHATFEGQDAQLDAAIDYLTKEIREHPVPVPPPPKYPNKSLPPVKPR